MSKSIGIMLSKKLFIVTTLLAFSVQLCFGQNNTGYFKNKNYYSLGGGFIFNNPTVTENNFNIDKLYSNDKLFSLQWHHFYKIHFGTIIKIDWSNQSTRYGFKTAEAYVIHTDYHNYLRSSRFSITPSFTYNFNATKKINFLLFLGPQLHVNKPLNQFDSTLLKFKGGDATHNIKQFGYGFNLGLSFNYKINDYFYLFLNPSYQRGFVVFREAIVGTSIQNSMINYNGTGPSIIIGATFRRKPPKESEE